MQGVQSRLINAAMWPVTVWMSFAHFNDHAADDYVERTAPIVAVAIAFWLMTGAALALWLVNGPINVFSVLLVFLPVIYVIGLAMFSAREEKFRS